MSNAQDLLSIANWGFSSLGRPVEVSGTTENQADAFQDCTYDTMEELWNLMRSIRDYRTFDLQTCGVFFVQLREHYYTGRHEVMPIHLPRVRGFEEEFNFARQMTFSLVYAKGAQKTYDQQIALGSTSTLCSLLNYTNERCREIFVEMAKFSLELRGFLDAVVRKVIDADFVEHYWKRAQRFEFLSLTTQGGRPQFTLAEARIPLEDYIVLVDFLLPWLDGTLAVDSFHRCPQCGKYFFSSGANARFCSIACRSRYRRQQQ